MASQLAAGNHDHRCPYCGSFVTGGRTICNYCGRPVLRYSP